MKKEHINDIKGIVVLALGIILLLSLISFTPDDLSWYTSQPNSPTKNLIGVVGASLAGALNFIMGYSSYFLVLYLFFWSWNKFNSRELKLTFAKLVACLVLLGVISALFSMTGLQDSDLRYHRSGYVGFVLSSFLVQYLDWTGAYIVLLALGALTLIVTSEFLISPVFFKLIDGAQETIGKMRDQIVQRREKWAKEAQRSTSKMRPAVKPYKLPRLFPQKKPVTSNDDESQEALALEQMTAGQTPKPQKPKSPNIRITEKSEAETKEEKTEPKVVGEYHVPHLGLLNSPPQISANQIQLDLRDGAQKLELTLANFNVAVRVADIERGPVITRYELEPAPGVKVNKITTLSDDIALAMKAPAVRIVAPIPGKNRVGIEVPNSSTAAVYLRDVLSLSSFQSSESKLMLGIGKDISGKPLIANLAEMPHLLIAGTTGAGKTVCVNSIIMSMLFNASPDQVKFLMVDPKMVELTQYNDIPHMLCPAVTDAKRVSAALNWVVGEMESRYSMLSKAGVRNISAFHSKGNQLPYIIIIIDELADLMQVAAKTIESAITRLAQLSRAVGIHLILATQRPSVDVITGVIKANFPARISFKVASKVDSRTVLDMNGAENLIGKGDLLFIKPGDAKPTRGQCSFVSDEEVHRVIEFIKVQAEPTYDDTILKQQSASATGGSEEKDDLYDEAVQLVIETNQASVSILQRRMRLGYTRAARLIDMMEQDGIVGPYCGSKPREILVDREEWLLEHMNTEQEEKES